MLSCISDIFFLSAMPREYLDTFLSLSRFLRTRERLYINRVRSLLSMRYMLLGYSFEPRPYTNSHALGTTGSVMTIGLSINGCSHSKNQFDERELD